MKDVRYWTSITLLISLYLSITIAETIVVAQNRYLSVHQNVWNLFIANVILRWSFLIAMIYSWTEKRNQKRIKLLLAILFFGQIAIQASCLILLIVINEDQRMKDTFVEELPMLLANIIFETGLFCVYTCSVCIFCVSKRVRRG